MMILIQFLKILTIYKHDIFSSMHDLVKPFVDNGKTKNWGNFFIEGKKILSKIDTHHFKMLLYIPGKSNA